MATSEPPTSRASVSVRYMRGAATASGVATDALEADAVHTGLGDDHVDAVLDAVEAALPGLSRPVPSAPLVVNLHLEMNFIGDEGVRRILRRCAAWAATSVLVLTRLRLHMNRIGDGGARALAEFIRFTPPDRQLQEVHLSHNRIALDGAEALLAAVAAAYPRVCERTVAAQAAGRGRGRGRGRGGGPAAATRTVRFLVPLWLRLEQNHIDTRALCAHVRSCGCGRVGACVCAITWCDPHTHSGTKSLSGAKGTIKCGTQACTFISRMASATLTRPEAGGPPDSAVVPRSHTHADMVALLEMSGAPADVGVRAARLGIRVVHTHLPYFFSQRAAASSVSVRGLLSNARTHTSQHRADSSAQASADVSTPVSTDVSTPSRAGGIADGQLFVVLDTSAVMQMMLYIEPFSFAAMGMAQGPRGSKGAATPSVPPPEDDDDEADGGGDAEDEGEDAPDATPAATPAMPDDTAPPPSSSQRPMSSGVVFILLETVLQQLDSQKNANARVGASHSGVRAVVNAFMREYPSMELGGMLVRVLSEELEDAVRAGVFTFATTPGCRLDDGTFDSDGVIIDCSIALAAQLGADASATSAPRVLLLTQDIRMRNRARECSRGRIGACLWSDVNDRCKATPGSLHASTLYKSAASLRRLLPKDGMPSPAVAAASAATPGRADALSRDTFEGLAFAAAAATEAAELLGEVMAQHGEACDCTVCARARGLVLRLREGSAACLRVHTHTQKAALAMHARARAGGTPVTVVTPVRRREDDGLAQAMGRLQLGE